MKNIHPFYMIKNEDLAAYKRFAEQGMDLMFPVSIRGRSHRPDINIPYHNTIKLFDTTKDKPEHVHAVASQLQLHPPNPKEVHIEPTTLKGRQGNIMHVIKLHGADAETIKAHHGKFGHLGYKENYQYSPHITVDKATWDQIVESKAKTAHEAGINFHHAELHHKDKVVNKYSPKEDHKDKLAASEDMKKGALANIGVAAAMGLGLLATNTSEATHPHKSNYSSQHMLRAIASVESSGGKNVNHAAGGGPIHGAEHAYGKYGLMPQTIRETISMNHDLKSHKKAAMLRGQDLHNYMKDNPGLEDMVAEKHLKRLEHHFGNNPSDLGYAWLQGIKGTYAAKKKKEDTSNHWHAKKVSEAYSKGK